MELCLDNQSIASGELWVEAKFSGGRKTLGEYFTQPVVRLLARIPINPNTITWLGFFITVGATALIVTGHLLAAGFVVLAAGFFDILDGALARRTGQTSQFGAVLDSTLDRVGEAVQLLGILALFLLTSTAGQCPVQDIKETGRQHHKTSRQQLSGNNEGRGASGNQKTEPGYGIGPDRRPGQKSDYWLGEVLG